MTRTPSWRYMWKRKGSWAHAAVVYSLFSFTFSKSSAGAGAEVNPPLLLPPPPLLRRLRRRLHLLHPQSLHQTRILRGTTVIAIDRLDGEVYCLRNARLP